MLLYEYGCTKCKDTERQLQSDWYKYDETENHCHSIEADSINITLKYILKYCNTFKDCFVPNFTCRSIHTPRYG